MSFSDPRYVLFLGLVAVLLPLVPRGTPRLVAMTAVSAGFYSLFSPWYVLILACVGASAFSAGLLLTSDCSRRGILFVAALTTTVLPLLFFKYAPSLPGASDWLQAVVFPVGVSFYTFLALGYLIEVYLDPDCVERSPVRFAAFVSFFPQLLAGPIERSRHLLPQLSNLGVFDYDRVVAGLRSILVGLSMKLIIADALAPYVDQVFANPQGFGAADLALGTVYFSFQVYADFAGYSLVAIGSARLLGIELMTNFEQPYLSHTLPEFWRTWHISLSSWFRDYVFTPLHFQVRRRGWVGLAGALIFTFALVGAWHGSSPKYVLFGVAHGVLVAFSTLTFKARDKFWRGTGVPAPLLRIGRTLLTFSIVSLTFVLFRASGVTDAIRIYRRLFWHTDLVPTLPLATPLALIAALVVGDVLVRNQMGLAHFAPPLRWLFYYGTGSALAFVALQNLLDATPNVRQFIYFHF